MRAADTVIALQTGILAAIVVVSLVLLHRIKAQRAYNAKRGRP